MVRQFAFVGSQNPAVNTHDLNTGPLWSMRGDYLRCVSVIAAEPSHSMNEGAVAVDCVLSGHACAPTVQGIPNHAVELVQ